MRDALDLLREFCKAYFERRDAARAQKLMTDDVRWFGALSPTDVRGREQACAYMARQIERTPKPYTVQYGEGECYEIAPGASEGFLRVRLASDGFERMCRMTGTCRAQDGDVKLCALHMSVTDAETVREQPASAASADEKESMIRDELLNEVFSGGMTMCYCTEGYPLYYVNRNMWTSLGYASEEEYRRDIGDMAITGVHPDDRAQLRAEIDAQLLGGDGYAIEYRKRKRDGTYIWVQEFGKALMLRDGQPGVSSVIFDVTERKNTQAQMDNMVNAITGGVALYRYRNGECEQLFQSDGVGLLTGRTAEECAKILDEGLATAIFADDLPLAVAAMDKAAASDETVSVAYRVFGKAGSYIWVNACFRRLRVEEDAAILHAVFTPLPLQSELYQTLARQSGSGIVVRDAETYELLYTNKAARSMLGADDGAYAGRKCYEYFNFSDEPCDHCNAESYEVGGITEVKQYIPRLDRYFLMKGTVIDWAGRRAVVEYLDDVTELEKSRRQVDDLIHTVPCGICLYRWDGKELYPLIANRQLSEMLGEEALAYLRSVKGLNYTHVHPEDREELKRQALRALTGDHEVDFTYRSQNARTGEYLWVRMRGASVMQEDGTWLAYVSYYDVTREHQTEQKLRESESLLEYAAAHAGLWYWRVDLRNNRAWLDARHQREFGVPPVMEDFIDTWLDMGFIHPDYADAYREAFRRVQAGERQVTFDTRIYMKDGSLHWGRMCFTNLINERGADDVAVCTGVLVDAEKELYAKYELEKRKPSLGERTLLVHALFNLTTGATLEYVYQDGSTVPPEGRTAFTGDKDYLDELLIDPGEREQYRAINDRGYLMERYERGETELSIDYRRVMPGGDVVWVRNILHLVRDPDSSDVLLFEYCYDVEDEKIRELMYRSLATDNYDFIVKLNVRTGRYNVLHRAGTSDDWRAPMGDDADVASAGWISHSVIPEDRDMTLRNAQVASIRKNLIHRERFEFTCRCVDDSGALRHKKITQYYIDRQRDIVVMTREDVTALIRDETQKNEALAGALEAAKQASRAKSQFLSRMSHELRTPMNAIIGLSALAATDVDNPVAMEDTITKIGLSARYLLSLINDILEMSRIESGRMTLNEGPFNFEELISSVNNLIFSQATEKGLDYDAIVNSFMESDYVGDATKLQQILINVLGNAVKFTPAGGKVTLTMEQVRRVGERATLRFVVSDTGVGIDEKFIPRLFDAFAQESSSFTSTSTGTGLGLAITKSMVDMMSGSIRVQSVKNVGSVFTLEVQVGISEQSQRQTELLASMNLSRLKALVVDDDVMVCQSTQHILSGMGMQTEWVDSGCRAIERVSERHDRINDFDAIFIDWKMPDMDGIETTREIRRIVGPDITIIIMTAYDWKGVENEARDAGVDMFMEKPLFQSSIVSAFAKIFSAHKDKLTVRPPVRYDFTGKRFLLAEDHPLNVEVARRLLEKVGAQVIVANNGLEALELFTTSDDHAFDAILMDVRMPIMDGLTATKNIRNLKKAGSRDVPIIAMTANAFDEDVDLSMTSGMDAHLIKPIDPQNLFATLKRLMKE